MSFVSSILCPEFEQSKALALSEEWSISFGKLSLLQGNRSQIHLLKLITLDYLWFFCTYILSWPYNMLLIRFRKTVHHNLIIKDDFSMLLAQSLGSFYFCLSLNTVLIQRVLLADYLVEILDDSQSILVSEHKQKLGWFK